MRYMLVMGAAPEAWAEDEPADDGVIGDWDRYTRALADAGVLVGGHGLHGADAATTVRVRAGQRIVVDGPFAETKEHLIGYYVIDVDDLDVALDWAARAPNARIGSVEVRPVLPGSATDESLARS